MATTENRDSVGFKRPPESSRFKAGKSGNPNGRPKGRKHAAPYESVLGQKVTIREHGVERVVTASEAFLLKLVQRGIGGSINDAKLAKETIAIGRQIQSNRQERHRQLVELQARGSAHSGFFKLRPQRPATCSLPMRATLGV